MIREYGFPVLSKEIAGKIYTLQHPTEKNATVRHAIMTGETGAYGGYRKGTRMKMAQKWLEIFGGPENEREGTDYKTAPFQVSELCCYYLKEKPCDDYAKESGRFPYMGLMASEGGRRQKALMLNGCNYISKTTKRSAPFAIFTRQDLLTMTLEMEAWYQEHWEEFDGNGEHLETIVPEIYGKIVRDPLNMTQEEIEEYKAEHGGTEPEGQLRTTKAQRTGCSMCGFGIHIEKRPNRFDQLRHRNPREWEMWMKHICQDETGEWYGWGRVLDYIGIGWEDDLFDREDQKPLCEECVERLKRTLPWRGRRRHRTRERAGPAEESGRWSTVLPLRRCRDERICGPCGHNPHAGVCQRGHAGGPGGLREPVQHTFCREAGGREAGKRQEGSGGTAELPPL